MKKPIVKRVVFTGKAGDKYYFESSNPILPKVIVIGYLLFVLKVLLSFNLFIEIFETIYPYGYLIKGIYWFSLIVLIILPIEERTVVDQRQKNLLVERFFIPPISLIIRLFWKKDSIKIRGLMWDTADMVERGLLVQTDEKDIKYIYCYQNFDSFHELVELIPEENHHNFSQMVFYEKKRLTNQNQLLGLLSLIAGIFLFISDSEFSYYFGLPLILIGLLSYTIKHSIVRNIFSITLLSVGIPSVLLWPSEISIVIIFFLLLFSLYLIRNYHYFYYLDRNLKQILGEEGKRKIQKTEAVLPYIGLGINVLSIVIMFMLWLLCSDETSICGNTLSLLFNVYVYLSLYSFMSVGSAISISSFSAILKPPWFGFISIILAEFFMFVFVVSLTALP